jgi:hypothetical protein
MDKIKLKEKTREQMKQMKQQKKEIYHKKVVRKLERELGIIKKKKEEIEMWKSGSSRDTKYGKDKILVRLKTKEIQLKNKLLHVLVTE